MSDTPTTYTISVNAECGTHPTLDQFEKEAIALTLRLSKGNKREAASRLGIARSTLLAKIRKYQLVDA